MLGSFGRWAALWLLLIAVALAAPGRAQESPQDGEAAARQAVTDGRAALEQAIRDKGPAHPETGARHMDLATALFRQGDLAGADAELRRATEIFRAAPPEDPALAPRALQNLAYVLAAQRHYEQAVALYREAIALYETLGLDAPSDIAGYHKNLAESLVALERNAEAEVHYRAALESYALVREDWGHALDAVRKRLIGLYRQREAYDEAEALYRETIAYRKQAFGEDHHEVVAALSGLAFLFEDQGRVEEAEALHRDGLALYRRSLGEDHYVVGWKHIDLGRLYRKAGREAEAAKAFADAEPFLAPYLAYEEERLGADSPDFARRLIDTAETYRQEVGNLDEAGTLYARALAIQEAAFGADDPALIAALEGLGLVYEAQRRFAPAIPVHERLLALRERQHGGDSPALVRDLGSLAYALNETGRSEAAEAAIGRSLAITVASEGADSIDAGERYNELAILARRRGDLDLAEQRYLTSIEIFRRAAGPEHRLVMRQRVGLIRIAEQSGQVDKAIAHGIAYLALTQANPSAQVDFLEALLVDAILRQPQPAGTEELFESLAEHADRDYDTRGMGRSILLYNLAAGIRANGDTALAERYFQRSLAAYRETGGDDPNWMAPQLHELAALARDDGRLEQAYERVSEAVSLLIDNPIADPTQLVSSESLLGVVLQERGEPERSGQVLARALDRTGRIDEPIPRLASLIRYNLANQQARVGEHETALATLAPALSTLEDAFGADDPDYALYLKYRGLLHADLGDGEQAETDLRRAIALETRNGRIETPLGADMLADLGAVLSENNRFEDALPPLRRALDIRTAALGPAHPSTADAQIALGDAYRSVGRYDLALAPFRQGLAIREGHEGMAPEQVVWALERVADTEGFLGDLAKAEALFERALAIWRDSADGGGRWIGSTLRSYANIKRFRARYDEAEGLAKRALAADEAAFGEASPELVPGLGHLVELYLEMGRSFDAAEHQLRAIALLESAGDGDPIGLANGLIKLAFIKTAWREKQEVERLLARARETLDRVERRNREAFGLALMELGKGYEGIDRIDEAERSYLRTQQVLERTSAKGDFNRVLVKLHLGNIKVTRKDFAAALPLMESVFEEIRERLGPDNPIAGVVLQMTPALYLLNGEPEKALAMFDESVKAGESGLFEAHPMQSFINAFRGLIEWQRGDLEAARRSLSTASAMGRQIIQRAAQDRSRSGVSGSSYSASLALPLHIALLHRLAGEDPAKRETYLAEAFELAQQQQQGSAAGALARMAARFGAGSDRLAGIVRERQDRLEQWTNVSKRLAGAAALPIAQRDRASEAEMRDLLGRLDEEMAALDARIERDFPDYAALIRPGAIPLGEIQSLLQADEALLYFSVGETARSAALEAYLEAFLPGRTTLWIVRRDRLELQWIDLNQEQLEESVNALRRTLDPSVLFVQRLEDVPAFAQSTAHALYRQIFAPAEPFLAGARNVFVVPSGPLQSLPLGVLITEPSEAPTASLADHGKLNWLARDYAMTTLPSVASLRSLRHFARAARAGAPFTGFGNPILEGRPGEVRGLNLAAMFRGALADVQAVRDLPALPESEQELYDMAEALQAGPESVFLQARATEAQVKSMDLSDSRVLAFATHGLVAGELEDNVEPALVLTPPESGSDLDDGLLTASEIAQLKLNADWVILSACNTASGSRPGAEGLSGLARAFFYAGSRALLVSHWPVVSDAAVKLTTRMLESARRDGLTRAEALQLSLIALMEDPEHPYYAHPMFWAPFTVVGEGGALGG